MEVIPQKLRSFSRTGNFFSTQIIRMKTMFADIVLLMMFLDSLLGLLHSRPQGLPNPPWSLPRQVAVDPEC